MFSYSVNVRKINSASKLKGIATIVVDDILELDGFKIIEGSKGLFVSVPSHKGTVMEEGQKVEKYFDDIRFKGEDGLNFSKELKDSILSAYTSASDPLSTGSSNSSYQKADVSASREKAAAQTDTSSTERQRKPIWGF